MNYEETLREYHRRIGEIFLAKDQTPYRICKQLWTLHAEFERRLTLVVDGAGGTDIESPVANDRAATEL